MTTVDIWALNALFSVKSTLKPAPTADGENKAAGSVPVGAFVRSICLCFTKIEFVPPNTTIFWLSAASIIEY